MGRASHLSFDCSDSPICPLRGWPMTNALIGTCDRYLWSTSGSILDRHPDRYSVDTLRQSINNWQSVDRLTWIDWKLVDFQPTCWSRCWWGVNQVSSEVSMECQSSVIWGVNGVLINCQSRVDWGYQSTLNYSCLEYTNVPPFKDNFQSVLCTLESLFMFFSFVSCKTSQNVNILKLLTWSKFKV